MIDYQNTPVPPVKKSGGSPVMMIISGVLVVALIAVAVMWVMTNGKLTTANNDIKGLEANVSTLTTQLNTEKATVSDLTTKLATETAKVTSLTADLATANASVTKLTGDLSTANASVIKLTADLASSAAKVSSLTADLSTANAKVTSTQASLDLANANLAVANTTIASQTASLTKMKSPRFFNTTSELTTWLAQDDTNTNPAYAAYNGTTKSYILQIKALRDGYIIAAFCDWDNSYIYYGNTTMAGGVMVAISTTTDGIVFGPSWSVPVQPLP